MTMTKPALFKMALRPGARSGIWNGPGDLVLRPPAEVDSPSVLPGEEGSAPPSWGEEDWDWLLLFGTHADRLRPWVHHAVTHLGDVGILWIAYPKGVRKAALPTDLKREAVWKLGAEVGLRAVAQVSVDSVWSALRFKRT